MHDDRDPYEVLGVDKEATTEEIEAAYRRLVQRTHPDVGGTSLLFRQVKDAYDALSDPTRRAKPDLDAQGSPAGTAGASPSSSGWTRVDDTQAWSSQSPPGQGFPPPRTGPYSPPPRGAADPGRPFSGWGAPGPAPGPGWPGSPQTGSPQTGSPHTGASPGSWQSPPPGIASAPGVSPRASSGFWTSRPWLIATGVGLALLVAGTRDAGLAVLGFMVLLVGLLAAAGSRGARARLALRDAQVGHADCMDGTTFEHFAAEVLRANGYRVDHVGRVGDYGADLIIAGPSGRSVVQVKRYSGNVGVDAVREAAAARAHYRTRGAIVLTNSYFTNQAVVLGRSNQVELWDRNTLVRLASQCRALSPPPAPAVLGLELASGIAVIAKFLLSASPTSTRRRRPARRRRR